MTYEETIHYLYSATPQFQKIGAAAYKPGLGNAIKLDELFGSPHHSLKMIHVAGTNGKGSICHTLASILQHAGYKIGLYTSPHLIDFRERIRVNGEKIEKEAVIDFVQRYIDADIDLSPSFFELTTIMAFDYFRNKEVDFAIIETGLGGRLDTTNIITPIVSIISNISKDHIAQLGNTLESIAREKSGIIKRHIPVIIGNSTNSNIRDIFVETAAKNDATIVFAEEENEILEVERHKDHLKYKTRSFDVIEGELTGDYQIENTATILEAVKALRKIGIEISDEAVKSGFRFVMETTHIAGRWMKISEKPLVICDTGHNEGGWQYLSKKLDLFAENLIMVIGFVNDKDVDNILKFMPRKAAYIFCQADIPRAMPSEALTAKARQHGIDGENKGSVTNAFEYALKKAKLSGANVFIGGSTFVIADLLKYLEDKGTIFEKK